MHSLNIQLLIAFIDREFSPEEYSQLLDEAGKELGYEGMLPFYEIHNRINAEREALREKFGHPASKFFHRQAVKQVVGEEAEQASRPQPPHTGEWNRRGVRAVKGSMCEECGEVATENHVHSLITAEDAELPPVPREALHAKMDFS